MANAFITLIAIVAVVGGIVSISIHKIEEGKLRIPPLMFAIGSS